MTTPLLIYGANGYTGDLVARRAVERGLRPVLAGRSPEPVAALARSLGLEHRAFGLEDPAAIDRGLEGIAAVLHCAGPFSRTAEPMADACVRRRVHYLDVTGEIAAFAQLHRRDAAARDAGVMLLPGVGFDVVPSDSLAAHLARRLPGAQRLTLAFQTVGRPSRGTTLTALEGMGQGGAIRRGGALVRVPAGWRTRTVDLGEGPTACISIPWGDVFTAHLSTGIPDVEVYLAAPPRLRLFIRATRLLGPLLASRPVQRALADRVRRTMTGPDERQRSRGRTLLWGEVEDGAGRRIQARMRAPEGSAFTALSAVACAEAVLAGRVKPGFQTPSLAFGADFVLGIPGVERTEA